MACPEAWAQSCRLVSYGEAAITREADGLGVVTATLEGKPVKVWVNPNSRYTLVPRKKIEEWGAKTRRNSQSLMMVGSDTLSDVAILGRLQLGAAGIGNLEAFVDERPLGVDLI